jgi:hypothetical protein
VARDEAHGSCEVLLVLWEDEHQGSCLTRSEDEHGIFDFVTAIVVVSLFFVICFPGFFVIRLGLVGVLVVMAIGVVVRHFGHFLVGHRIVVVGMATSDVLIDAILIREAELVLDDTGIGDDELDRLTRRELEAVCIDRELREIHLDDAIYIAGWFDVIGFLSMVVAFISVIHFLLNSLIDRCGYGADTVGWDSSTCCGDEKHGCEENKQTSGLREHCGLLSKPIHCYE